MRKCGQNLPVFPFQNWEQTKRVRYRKSEPRTLKNIKFCFEWHPFDALLSHSWGSRWGSLKKVTFLYTLGVIIGAFCCAVPIMFCISILFHYYFSSPLTSAGTEGLVTDAFFIDLIWTSQNAIKCIKRMWFEAELNALQGTGLRFPIMRLVFPQRWNEIIKNSSLAHISEYFKFGLSLWRHF